LPREEWARLDGTELETVYPVLPDDAEVVIVEDDGRIVACWAAFNRTHVECVWIHPSYRKRVSVARRLLVGMFDLLRRRHVKVVNTASCSDEVSRLLLKLGAVELVGAHYALKVGK
jgi:ribosomal protein S18 acetylase RimI-like enzyme